MGHTSVPANSVRVRWAAVRSPRQLAHLKGSDRLRSVRIRSGSMTDMESPFRTWLDAWLEAAYGNAGFWRTARPAAHFRTASTTGPQLGGAVLAVLDQHPEVAAVIELGAGDAMLLADLACARPDLHLTGVDLRARPAGLPAPIDWRRDLWDVRAGAWTTGSVVELFAGLTGPALVVCVEWLDDLPCGVGVRTGSGLRTVQVDSAGHERPGPSAGSELTAWAERWSPTAKRLEFGSTRDDAWAWICRALWRHGGLALLVDYGHLAPGRPRHGSLAAFCLGRQVHPRPSPELNLTAAVAVDSLADAGHRVGATTLLLGHQQDLIRAWPAQPAATLEDLVAHSQHAALTSASTWGPHYWLLQHVPHRR